MDDATDSVRPAVLPHPVGTEVARGIVRTMRRTDRVPVEPPGAPAACHHTSSDVSMFGGVDERQSWPAAFAILKPS